MRFTRVRRALTAAVASAALIAAGAVSAQASDRLPAETATSAPAALNAAASSGVTPEQVAEAFAELSASNLPRTVQTQLGVIYTTFTLNGVNFTFQSSRVAGAGSLFGTAAGTDAVVSPQVGGGYEAGRGLYISFTAGEQQALLAGGGAALVGAICIIPAVGTVACVVAGVVVAAATAFVADRGICTNRRWLRVYTSSMTGRCV
ncbi:MAG: hypothetical protein KJ792_10325 [Actinobacteria bacterium]|nr:hypothetical protein [Actinomycetota bacterium]MCG2803250.1 hypothetical protein [Cellulomonas sp.]